MKSLGQLEKHANRRKQPREVSGKVSETLDNPRKVQVSPDLASDITFKQLNLMDQWPIRGPFDVIFCRNVVIYFDKPTQQKLFKRYYDMLAPGGTLFLGHSEQLGAFQEHFDALGKTTFRKIG